MLAWMIRTTYHIIGMLMCMGALAYWANLSLDRALLYTLAAMMVEMATKHSLYLGDMKKAQATLLALAKEGQELCQKLRDEH